MFRRPSPEFRADAILELRPFTDIQIRNSLDKAKAYSSATVSEIFASRPDLVVALRNPFTAGLVVAYSEQHRRTLPSSQVDLYSAYVRPRLENAADEVRRIGRRTKPLESETILDYAAAIAAVMVDNLGLETELSELKSALEKRGPKWGSHVDLVAAILVRAKIARLGGPPDWHFSFTHRRFAEFFVAHGLPNQQRLPLDSIPRDEPRQEALALYCEIAEDHIATNVARYCWREIRSIDECTLTASSPEFRHAIQCLRFLETAYRRRSKSVETFQDELGALVVRTLGKTNDILVVKLLVEATGILTEVHIDKVVTTSLSRRDAWISETALRACRHLPQPSSELIEKLEGYLREVQPLEFVQRHGELRFSFNLSYGFRTLKRNCELRLLDMASCAAGVVIVIFVDPVLVIYPILSVCVVVLLEYVSGRVVTGDTSTDWNLYLGLGRGVVGLTSMLLIRDFTLTEALFGLEPMLGAWTKWLGMVGACLILPYYQLGMLIRRMRRLSLRGAVEWLGRMVLAGGGWLGLVVVSNASGWVSEIVECVVGYGAIVGMLIVLGGQGVRNWRAWRRDRRRLKEVRVEGQWDRMQIAEILQALETAGGRDVFVTMLQQVRMKPSGSWPEGVVPNFGHDRASSELARLEEGWLDLRR